MEKLKARFDDTLLDYIENEKILKGNIKTLAKENEDLEKDRMNERALRIRLEEEYMQNSKNHEEEVGLRLKFESKLNQMHTQQRETDIQYHRAREEMEQARRQIKTLEKRVAEQQKTLVETQIHN